MLSIAKCWRAKCLSLWRLCIHLLVATFSGTTYCDIKQNSSRLFHGTHQWMFCFKMASTIKLEDMLGFIITIWNPISKWCFQNIIIINAKGVKKCHKYTIFILSDGTSTLYFFIGAISIYLCMDWSRIKVHKHPAKNQTLLVFYRAFISTARPLQFMFSLFAATETLILIKSSRSAQILNWSEIV